MVAAFFASEVAAGIDRRLTEWGRWCRDRIPQGRCFSIEHRYRRKSREDDTPTGWGDWTRTVPGNRLLPINELAALEIERTMRRLPNRHRKALKLHYVSRTTSSRICDRLALRYGDWDAFLEDCQAMVANLLRLRASKHYATSPPDNLMPTLQVDELAPHGAESYAEVPISSN